MTPDSKENFYMKAREDRDWEYERLERQVDYGLKFEKPAWNSLNLKDKNLRSWGCGQGLYDIRLSEMFPGVNIEAFDSDKEMINRNEREFYDYNNVSFYIEEGVDQSFYEVDINYARFVVQHLTDENSIKLVKNMVDSTKIGGLVILIDTIISEMELTPELPENKKVLTPSVKRIESYGGNRDSGKLAKDYMEEAGLSDIQVIETDWIADTPELLREYRDFNVPNYRIRYGDQVGEEIDKLDEWFEAGISGEEPRKLVEKIRFVVGRKE